MFEWSFQYFYSIFIWDFLYNLFFCSFASCVHYLGSLKHHLWIWARLFYKLYLSLHVVLLYAYTACITYSIVKLNDLLMTSYENVRDRWQTVFTCGRGASISSPMAVTFTWKNDRHPSTLYICIIRRSSIALTIQRKNRLHLEWWARHYLASGRLLCMLLHTYITHYMFA